MRVMKSMRSKKPARSKKAASAKHASKFADKAGAIVSVLIVAFIAVAMLMAREPVMSAGDSEGQPAAAADSSALIRTGAPIEDMPVKTTGERTTATATATATASDQKTAPVTIVGCVQQDDQGFRLTKTSGADAPKARSWKSGFMRKGSASLDLVDASGGLRLASHVGQRVSVTGMLDDRELRARSLRRVSESCN